MTIALIISGGGIGTLLLWIVGVAVCFAIVYGIFRALVLPEWAYTALYVLAGVILLILAIDFFFGSGGPITVTR